jgi:hypothetical protein
MLDNVGVFLVLFGSDALGGAITMNKKKQSF